MITIDQLDNVGKRHAATRLDSFDGGFQFVTMRRVYSYNRPVTVDESLPQTRAILGFGQNGQILYQFHLGQFCLSTKFIAREACRWMVEFVQHQKYSATPLAFGQAMRRMQISVPVRVRPPATFFQLMPLALQIIRLVVNRPSLRGILSQPSSPSFQRVSARFFLESPATYREDRG